MVETRDDADAKKKVLSILKSIPVALFGTRDERGRTHSRPMIAQHHEFDGVLWFFTTADSAKVTEIRRDPTVHVGYADQSAQNYVSVVGRAEVLRDPVQAKKLWSEPMRIWFTKGPEDPDLALVKVDVESAEYWDAPSSRMIYAFGYLKAVTTGKPPSSGEHNEVRFDR